METIKVEVLPYTGPEKTDQVTRGKQNGKRYHVHTGEVPQEKQAHWNVAPAYDPLVEYYEAKAQ